MESSDDRDLLARSLTPHGEALAAVAEHCRGVARDEFGVEIPPIGLLIDFVAMDEQCVHHDGHASIRVAVHDLGAFDAPPDGANLRYAICHEMGHLTTIHTRPDHASPGVVWDEALAHLLATDWYLPALPSRLAPPGSGEAWRTLEVSTGAADPDVTASLDRCVDQLHALSGRDTPRLMRAMGRVPRDRLRSDRFFDAVRRAVGSADHQATPE